MKKIIKCILPYGALLIVQKLKRHIRLSRRLPSEPVEIKPKLTDGSCYWREFLKNSQGSTTSELIEVAKKSIWDFDIPSLEASISYCKRIWDIHGHSIKVRSELRSVYFRVKKFYPEHKFKRFRILYLNFLVQSGSYSALERELNSLEPEFFVKNRFSFSIALAAFLYDFSFCSNDSYFKQCSEVMRGTQRAQAEFEKKLAEEISFCVVGNGPGLKLVKDSSIIDNSDLVFRFNNFKISQPHSGVKTDIWVRAGGYNDIWRRPLDSFAYIVFSGPDRRYHSSYSQEIIEAYFENQNLVFIPARLYSELAIDLEAPPSAGLLLLKWLKDNVQHGKFSFFGFCNEVELVGNEKLGDQYFENHLRKDRYSHNWAIEKNYIIKNIIEA